MSARLDWEIEAERTEQHAQEDPELRRQRRRQRLLFALVLITILAIVGGIAAAIAVRLNTVDTRLRQTLIDAAQAEVTALKLGDKTAFTALMRSGDTEWLNAQYGKNGRFDRYQALKAQNAIQFTSSIPDDNATVDDLRGRVLVPETVNGQAYLVVWFFWRYADGWRHVPSDLTFWGDPQTISGQTTTINYDSLDAPLATALADRVERWWTSGCQYLQCPGTLPRLTVRIEHTQTDHPFRWDTQAPLTLVVNSPLAVGDRAPAAPLSPDLESAIAGQISSKLFDQASGDLTVNSNADASWLRQSIIEWMTALLLEHGNATQLSFWQSVTKNYGGSQAIVAVMHQLSPNADIGILSGALGSPLGTLSVDWSQFFQGRLALEKTLIQGGNDQPRFLELWDQSVPSAAALSKQQWKEINPALPQVQSASVGQDATLGTVATVQATVDGKATTLKFRVVGGTWKRVS